MSTDKARAIVRTSQYDSKAEGRFARRLAMLRMAREIKEWMYHPITFKIGDDCRYTPDFMVICNDDTVSFYEIKGSLTYKRAKGAEASRVRIHSAANQFPWFRFIRASPDREREWKFDIIPPA